MPRASRCWGLQSFFRAWTVIASATDWVPGAGGCHCRSSSERQGFWAASENIEDAFGPVGNNSVLNGMGPNVPVSSDAATAAAVAAAETGVVAATEAMPAPTMTSSPVIAAAGLEGAGAPVTAHPATPNFSVSFPAFTPPLSSGREVAKTISGSDIDTGSGDNGPTNGGGGDGSS